MDIYSDADDNVPLKPAKLRTIRLNRRPGVPYFGFGVGDTNFPSVFNCCLNLTSNIESNDAYRYVEGVSMD